MEGEGGGEDHQRQQPELTFAARYLANSLWIFDYNVEDYNVEDILLPVQYLKTSILCSKFHSWLTLAIPLLAKFYFILLEPLLLLLHVRLVLHNLCKLCI